MESLVIPNIYGLVRPVEDPVNHILLQERWKPNTDPANSGRFELPGGKWRAFEPALACLGREIAEETGLRVETVDVPHQEFALGADTVDVLTPPMVVQMTRGPYPSVLVILPCRASGTPASRGDGSRNAAWHDIGLLREMIDSEPGRFTALTYAVLHHAFNDGTL